jgi:glycerol dehydrogenase-like iron-containing ADH family enzyme
MTKQQGNLNINARSIAPTVKQRAPPDKNGQEMDIDKDESIKYLRQARKRRTLRVTIVYHDKSTKYLRQARKRRTLRVAIVYHDKSNTLHKSLARRTHKS